MFNMLNARKVEDELNVFAGLFNSHVFWVIWVLIAGFQVGGRGPAQPGRHGADCRGWAWSLQLSSEAAAEACAASGPPAEVSPPSDRHRSPLAACRRRRWSSCLSWAASSRLSA